MTKRIISTLLFIFIMLTQTALFTFAEHWASESINRWSDYGVIKGDDNGDFRPDDNITRAEFSCVVNRLIGYSSESSLPFLDVQPDKWYYKDMCIAKKTAYMSGDEAGNGNPENFITREESVVILGRVFSVEENFSDGIFSDSSEISDWAKGYVNAFYENKYISGYENNIFAPNKPVGRAETCKILDNIIKNYQNKIKDLSDLEIDGNLVLVKSNVTLSNIKIRGTLYITAGATGGEIRLDNINADKIVYFATNDASLVIKNSSSPITANSIEGRNKVVTYGHTTIPSLTVNGNIAISEMEQPAIKNLILNENSSLIIEKGFLEKITVNGGGCLVNGSMVEKGRILLNTLPDNNKDSASSAIAVAFGGGGGNSSSGGGGGTTTNITNITACLTSLTIKESGQTGISALSPAFNSNITEYTLTLHSGVDGFTLKAVSNTNEAAIYINNTPALSELYIMIPSGRTEIKVDLKIGMSSKKTYIITVTKEQAANNADVEKISSDTQNITIADLQKTGVLNLISSQLEAYKTAVTEKKNELSRGLTALEIQEVIDEVNKSVAVLSSITVVNKEEYGISSNLLHEFSAEKYDYTVYVDKYITYADVEAVTITGTVNVNETDSKIRVPLVPGPNTVNVKATAEKGGATQNYTINIIRDAWETNMLTNSFFVKGSQTWNLWNYSGASSSLAVQNSGYMKVSKTKSGTDYWHIILATNEFILPPNTEYDLEFLAKSADGQPMELKIIKTLYESDPGKPIMSNQEGEIFRIDGSAAVYNKTFSTEDGASNKAVRVTFQTGKGDSELELRYVKLRPKVVVNNKLSVLSVDNITLSPEFEAETLNYTGEFENGMSTVSLNVQTQDSKSTITVNGETKEQGQINIPLTPEVSNLITVIVKGEDNSTRTYTVTLTPKGIDEIIGDSNFLLTIPLDGTGKTSGANRGALKQWFVDWWDSNSRPQALTHTDGFLQVDFPDSFAGLTWANGFMIRQYILLEKNTEYTLSFTAKSDAQKSVEINLFKGAEAYNPSILNKTFDLTTEEQIYQVTFTTPDNLPADDQTLPNATSLTFGLSKGKYDVYLKNIKIEKKITD